MTSPTPPMARMLEALADGEWHDKDSVMRVGMPRVHPGVAYRRAESAREKAYRRRTNISEDVPVPQRTKTLDKSAIIMSGQKKICEDLLHAFHKRNKIEIRKTLEGRTEIRMTPEGNQESLLVDNDENVFVISPNKENGVETKSAIILALEGDVEAAIEEAARLEKEVGVLKDEVASVRSEREQLADRLEVLRGQLREAQAEQDEIERFHNEAISWKRRAELAEIERGTARRAIASLKAENRRLEDRLDELASIEYQQMAVIERLNSALPMPDELLKLAMVADRGPRKKVFRWIKEGEQDQLMNVSEVLQRLAYRISEITGLPLDGVNAELIR